MCNLMQTVVVNIWGRELVFGCLPVCVLAHSSAGMERYGERRSIDIRKQTGRCNGTGCITNLHPIPQTMSGDAVKRFDFNLGTVQSQICEKTATISDLLYEELVDPACLLA